MTVKTHCRICGEPLPDPFLDLGRMPLANAFLRLPAEFPGEERYPLAVCLCQRCGLVQLTVTVPPEQLYRAYPYVSSTSAAVRRYAGELAGQVIEKLGLGSSHQVVELGSNDGLVLRAFQERGVRVLGVEPARNVAAVARENGVHTVEEFFGEETGQRLARDFGPASVILGRHVFAHIDDLHDFFRGVDRLLTPKGVLLIEVPYLGNLYREIEFDTIYHEHLSYIALRPVEVLAQAHGFQLWDVERVPLHGGSILLWMVRGQAPGHPSDRLRALRSEEERLRLDRAETWAEFSRRLARWKEHFEKGVDSLSRAGARWAGYGAAAKANTLLNFCPSVAERLTAVLDRNPWKHGTYTPGTHLPVVSADRWEANGTTHLLILAWNFKEEIIAQMEPFARAGGRFFVPIPRPELVER